MFLYTCTLLIMIMTTIIDGYVSVRSLRTLKQPDGEKETPRLG